MILAIVMSDAADSDHPRRCGCLAPQLQTDATLTMKIYTRCMATVLRRFHAERIQHSAETTETVTIRSLQFCTKCSVPIRVQTSIDIKTSRTFLSGHHFQRGVAGANHAHHWNPPSR